MAKIVEVVISASKSAPKVVEIDARVVAAIIMRKTHAREKSALTAANAIMDYLSECMKGAASVS